MTIQTINGGFYFPTAINGISSGRFSTSTITTSANGDTVAFVFDAPATGTITGATVWLTSNVGGADLRLETVNGSGANAGKPTGTLANGSNSNVTIAAAATGAQTKTFTGSYSATIGDRLALVVKNTGTAQNVITSVLSGGNGDIHGMPNSSTMVWTSTTGTYSINANRFAQCAINYNGTYYWIPAMFACDNTANYTGSIGSGAERGLQFQLPFKAQVMGFFTSYAPSSVTADFDCRLYDNTNTGTDYTTIIGRTGILGGYSRATISSSYGQVQHYSFNGVATLSANTPYNLAIKQTTANAVTYHETKLLDTSVTAMAGMWNGGTNLAGILRASTGATTFTTSSTQFPGIMGIICSGFDDAAGGASSMIMSRLQAGM